nr:ATP-dependent DNA helicase SRS2-like protein At4g25120 [Ipomoea batatas]
MEMITARMRDDGRTAVGPRREWPWAAVAWRGDDGGQQRRAVIEAIRLLDNENKGTNSEFCKLNEMPDVKSPNQFKDKSKKWLKFVTQAWLQIRAEGRGRTSTGHESTRGRHSSLLLAAAAILDRFDAADAQLSRGREVSRHRSLEGEDSIVVTRS